MTTEEIIKQFELEFGVKYEDAKRDNGFNAEDLIGFAESVANNTEIIGSVSGSFPTEKEIEEAAESFGNLYSQDPNFANGCEAGWKAGAEWMKQSVER